MNKKPNRYFTNSKGERFNLEGHFVDYEGNFINYDGGFLEGFFHGKVLSDNPDYKVPECTFSYGFPVKMTVKESDGETYEYECLDGKTLNREENLSRIRMKEEEVMK